MNRTSEVGGAQRAEAGEFAGADGVALEAGLLVEQSLREVDGLGRVLLVRVSRGLTQPRGEFEAGE